jgi:hypothetical protein
MGGIVLAWLVGEGIITYRAIVKDHAPPIPGDLLAATGLFALLALVGEYQPARGVATLFAFGVDIAVLMQVLPGSGTKNAIKPTAAKTTAAKATPKATPKAAATTEA